MHFMACPRKFPITDGRTDRGRAPDSRKDGSDNQQTTVHDRRSIPTCRVCHFIFACVGSGDMSRDEFRKVVSNPKIQRILRELELDAYDLEYLFDNLDVDRNHFPEEVTLRPWHLQMHLSSKTLKCSKIARMAPMLTILGRNRSRRPDVFFAKIFAWATIFATDKVTKERRNER